MYDKYLKKIEEGLTPAPSEKYILELILKDARKNGPSIQYDNIAFICGVPSGMVEDIVHANNDLIQAEIKKSPYTQSDATSTETATFNTRSVVGENTIVEENESVPLSMRTIKALGIQPEDIMQLKKGIQVIMDNKSNEELFNQLKTMPMKRRNIVLSVLKNILSGNVDVLPLVTFLKKNKNTES